MVSVQEIVRHDLVIVVRSMRKCAAAVTIAKRPNTWDICSQFIIHDDVASFVGDDTGPVQPQILCVVNTSYREQKMAALHFRGPFLATHTNDDFVPTQFDRYALRI